VRIVIILEETLHFKRDDELVLLL